MTRVAVIGAGIGGLTTAIGLSRSGVQVELFEQAPEIGEVGAGLGLFPNAIRALRHLGLGAEIDAIGSRQTGFRYLRWEDGRIIGEVDERALESDFGAPHYTIHRADLIDALTAAAPDDAIRVGKRAVRVEQDNSGVEVRFADGSTVTADAVVAADGITSSIARQLGMATKPEPSGYAVYRGLVPAERLPPRQTDDSTVISVWLGPDKHFSHYWIRNGKLLNFMAVVHSPDQDEEEVWNVEGDLRAVRAEFIGWHQDVTAILDAAERTTLFGLFHRLTSSQWHTGRVALLGDAIHPMLPFGGQGAGMAIEDALTLSVLFEGATANDIPDLFDLYADLRWERTQRCQVISAEHAASFEVHDGPEQEVRDARIAHAASEPGEFFAPSAWLYGHDAADAARRGVEAANRAS